MSDLPGLKLRFVIDQPETTDSGSSKGPAAFLVSSGRLEVLNSEGKVLGFLPNFQGLKFQASVDDITLDVQMTFLCFENPFQNGTLVVA